MASGIMERYMENIVTKDTIVTTKWYEGWMIIVNQTINITVNIVKRCNELTSGEDNDGDPKADLHFRRHPPPVYGRFFSAVPCSTEMPNTSLFVRPYAIPHRRR
jgi:hypothetical protein